MGSLRDNHSRELFPNGMPWADYFWRSKSNTKQVYHHHMLYDLGIIWVMSGLWGMFIHSFIHFIHSALGIYKMILQLHITCQIKIQKHPSLSPLFREGF